MSVPRKSTTKKANPVTVAIVLVILAALFSLSTMGRKGQQPENVQRVEYYRYYTIVWYNSDLEEIRVDTDVYNIGCDGWDEDNEEGHNCILLNQDDMREFLTYVR